MRSLIALSVLTYMSVEGSAWANVLVSPPSSQPELRRVDAVVLRSPESGFQLLQRLTLTNTEHSQIVWLSVLPSLPDVKIGPSVFAELARTVDHPQSYSEQLRRNPFGPSVLTIVSRQINPELSSRPLIAATERQLQIHDLRFFPPTEPVIQKHNTQLPEELNLYLGQHSIELSPDVTQQIISNVRNGGVVLVAVLHDPEPGPQPAQVGPLHLSFGSGHPTIPLLLPASHSLELVVSALGSTPLAPLELPANTSDIDGKNPVAQSDSRSNVLFLGRLGLFPSLQAHLFEAFGDHIRSETILTHMSITTTDLKLPALHLVSADENPQAPLGRAQMPNPPGNPTDLLLCILLGLTPLGFTPEIWLLWFIGKQVRGTHRGAGWGEVRLARQLASVWCLVVAAYWLYTLVDIARVASLGPLLIGTVLIAVPGGRHEPMPVRIPFKKEQAADESPTKDHNPARA
ncbi:MAG: hypothetical protein KTR25_18760 [Myxococcales bacterium]|nr:hypothetical protein [Myxococcales bacterium]